MREESSRNDGGQSGSAAHSSRSWARMFADAARGVAVAMRAEPNFTVHLLFVVAVIALGAYLKLSLERQCLVMLCVASVLTAEMLNTAIEHLARAVTRESSPEIRDALDIASGAVLVAAIGAAAVGVFVLVVPLVAKA